MGSKIKFDEPSTGNAELELRIDLGERKFYELAKNLMNYKILLSTRVKILNALVRSRLTYSCQTWSISRVQFQRLSSVYCSMLRKMIKGGYRRKRDSWSYVLSNKDISCKSARLRTYRSSLLVSKETMPRTSSAKTTTQSRREPCSTAIIGRSEDGRYRCYNMHVTMPNVQ